MVIEFKFNFFSRSVLSYSSVTIYNRENKHVMKREREREKRTTRKSLAHSPPATVAKCNAANEARDIREPRQHAVVNRSFPRKRWLHLWKSRENARKKFERFVVQLASWITIDLTRKDEILGRYIIIPSNPNFNVLFYNTNKLRYQSKNNFSSFSSFFLMKIILFSFINITRSRCAKIELTKRKSDPVIIKIQMLHFLYSTWTWLPIVF